MRANRFTRRLVILLPIGFALVLTFCHRSSISQQAPAGGADVSAPTAGVVRRVFVNEGATVDKDAAIIEIGVPAQGDVPAQQDKKAERAAENDKVAAEAEANRTAAELRRIESLVKRGYASQAELDKARAQHQDAQDRLQRMGEKAKASETAPAGAEQIVAVRVPAAGTVTDIAVHAGEQVTIGQRLARVISGT
jgi:multidrug efflux pump subunit AcrA (membrane-fusion protein)